MLIGGDLGDNASRVSLGSWLKSSEAQAALLRTNFPWEMYAVLDMAVCSCALS